MKSKTVKFGALKVTQPIGEFYVARLDAHLVGKLTRADTRRVSTHERKPCTRNQGGRDPAKVALLTDHFSAVDAVAPHSIVLNLHSEHLKGVKQPKEGTSSVAPLHVFEVAEHEGAFSIIDGQHRLAGIAGSMHERFELVVTFFIGLPVEERAYLFSTLNDDQQKESKSLVFHLFDVGKTRSPQRTVLIITRALNMDENSPLYRKLKFLDAASSCKGESLGHAPLSQGSLARMVMQRISLDPSRDKAILRDGDRIELTGDEAGQGLIFRECFVKDKDAVILRILNNYFKAVATVFKDEWNSDDSPLVKTIGYDALFKLLDDLYVVGLGKRDLSREFFLDIMRTIRANRDKAQPKVPVDLSTLPATMSGVNKLHRQLREWAGVG